MIDIDQYAYNNNFSSFHPLEKSFFALFTILITLTANSFMTSIIVISVISLMLITAAGIPFKFYLKLLFIPLSFLIIASITAVVSFSRELNNYFFYFELGGWFFGLESKSLNTAALLFLKSFASICCLYFLTLTTPVLEIISVLRKFKLPEIVIELMMLIYRFIFVLLDTADLIRTSQLSRLGYSSIKKSFFSIAKLISNLFIRAYYRAQGLLTALVARGYDGKIRVLEKKYSFSYKNIMMIILFETFLIIVSIFGGGNFV